MAKLCRNETVEKSNRAAGWSGEKPGCVCECVRVGKQRRGNVLDASSKRGWQSEHMVNTEGSVTSLSCLVTISAHEESHQNWEHVEAPVLSCRKRF